MDNSIERNLGIQPIDHIMTRLNISVHDLVAASTEQITHKMVSRARKGRRLTPNVQAKIRNAINAACDKQYKIEDLFNYH